MTEIQNWPTCFPHQHMQLSLNKGIYGKRVPRHPWIVYGGTYLQLWEINPISKSGLKSPFCERAACLTCWRGKQQFNSKPRVTEGTAAVNPEGTPVQSSDGWGAVTRGHVCTGSKVANRAFSCLSASDWQVPKYMAPSMPHSTTESNT